MYVYDLLSMDVFSVDTRRSGIKAIMLPHFHLRVMSMMNEFYLKKIMLRSQYIQIFVFLMNKRTSKYAM